MTGASISGFAQNEIGVVPANEEIGDNTKPSLTFIYGYEINAHFISIFNGENSSMKQDLHPSHPDIDQDMWKRIDTIVSAGSSVPGSVIAVLRECQDVAGYLPVELIDYIAVGLNLSRSEVFGVASFYALFSLQPKGRNLVKMCMGTACYVKGIKEVINRVENHYGMKQGSTSQDRRFSLEAVRCLGACGLAPVMVVNTDTYGDVKADKIVQILDKYE